MFTRLKLVQMLENTDGRLLLALKTLLLLMPFVIKIIPLVRPLGARSGMLSWRRVAKRRARQRVRSEKVSTRPDAMM
jgi:hypothetical protein